MRDSEAREVDWRIRGSAHAHRAPALALLSFQVRVRARARNLPASVVSCACERPGICPTSRACMRDRNLVRSSRIPAPNLDEGVCKE
eukprot:5293333-Pleurochrysis_carterae.AAC.1